MFLETNCKTANFTSFDMSPAAFQYELHLTSGHNRYCVRIKKTKRKEKNNYHNTSPVCIVFTQMNPCMQALWIYKYPSKIFQGLLSFINKNFNFS